MKKGLILLSLLVAGTATIPLIKQPNAISVQETLKATDIIDLTMPPSGEVSVALPNLTKLLNTNIRSGRGDLATSAISLTNRNNKTLKWTNPYFDTRSINIILKYAMHVNKIVLAMSNTHPEWNYVYVYYTQVRPDIEEIDIIGRINWTWDDMSSYWTKGIKCDFELNY